MLAIFCTYIHEILADKLKCKYSGLKCIKEGKRVRRKAIAHIYVSVVRSYSADGTSKVARTSNKQETKKKERKYLNSKASKHSYLREFAGTVKLHAA